MPQPSDSHHRIHGCRFSLTLYTRQKGVCSMADRFQNYINGQWVNVKSGRTFENRNPANHTDLIGLFPASAAEDVEDAVHAAQKAFHEWRLVPAPKRGEILYRVGELLRRRKDEIARSMTREMGKIIKETRSEEHTTELQSRLH